MNWIWDWERINYKADNLRRILFQLWFMENQINVQFLSYFVLKQIYFFFANYQQKTNCSPSKSIITIGSEP